MSEAQAGSVPKASVNPTAMPLADAARLLSAAFGEHLSVAMLQADLAAGAPTNADGTLNLVHYAAWVCLMLRKESRRDSDADTPC